MEMKQFGLTETILFHFHRIPVLKNGGQGGGLLERPQDLPLQIRTIILILRPVFSSKFSLRK